MFFRMSILGVVILITSIVAIALLIYYFVYVKNINKAIQSGQKSRKKMVDIPKAIMITVIVLLLSYALILSTALKQSHKRASIVNRNSFAIIDLTDYTFSSYSGIKENNDASFAKLYSKESNEGYDKSIVKDGDFIFTIFNRKSDADEYHPDFLCYVDYIGEVRDEFQSYYNCEFIDNKSNKVSGGISSGGGSCDNNILFIGNLNNSDSFRITESFLDDAGTQSFREAEGRAYKADKGEFPSFTDYAISSGSVTITINQ